MAPKDHRQHRRKDHAAPTGTPDPITSGPVAVEVMRGGAVESRHRAAVAVVDSDGRVVLSAGDIERAIFPRSAIKPVQALALVETGAAEEFGLGDAEIALACASHGGDSRHVAVVRDWLARLGFGAADLECGAHYPTDAAAHRALAARREAPSPLHNNCSGKHAGFLSVARHLGQDTRGYVEFTHPVQQRVIGILEQMSGLDLADAARGLDGCSIPALALPLGNIALAMARLADPSDQPIRRQKAARRILAAMAAEPHLIAGDGQFATRVIARTKTRALVKPGAEGVYCAIFPELGLGAAIKIADGAARAAEVVMGYVLERLAVIDAADRDALSDLLRPTLYNWARRPVGEIRIVADFI